MKPEHAIPRMIDRLRRANIPLDNLCYELEELEWNEFMRYLEGFARYAGKDLSYVDECEYMGMRIRKRGARPTDAPR